jgi:hypothetical protein
MKQGLTRMTIALGDPELDCMGRGDSEAVWLACDRWLRKRGLRTDGELAYEAMIERRVASQRKRNANSRLQRARRAL